MILMALKFFKVVQEKQDSLDKKIQELETNIPQSSPLVLPAS